MLATIPVRWRVRIKHLRRRYRDALALERDQHALRTLLYQSNGPLAKTLLAHSCRQHGQMQCPFIF
ncbi:hypothetical protein WI58_12625 [Burkholderia cepacia]|nr:hypothetical protein WI49_33205 [Burkholderia cepacia]KVA65180.1 hypothetical protein WI48_37640 [Burkholderia cepacia]KVA77864.1 hypothetical protein WI51_27920 [Burkholderia cepacia]KVB11823.1 hypothetical protein WI54_06070 [Burkholderia cepacia]KVB19891.1 hypothetical protein WI55_34340 [Burkholderia cepacia]